MSDRSMMNTRLGVALLCASAWLGGQTACDEGGRAGIYESPLSYDGPVAVEGRFAYLNQTFGELVFVTPSVSGGQVAHRLDRLTVGVDPLEMVVSPSNDLVLVINGTSRDDGTDAQSLSVVDVEALREHHYALPSDYDAVTVGPDSRFVVAHYADAESGGSGDQVFRNQNEITVFDLDPDENGARFEQVDSRVTSLRSSPLGFDFAPPFEVDGLTHHLVVVSATSALALIDMTAEAEIDLQRRIFLVPENSPEVLIPQRVIFTEDDPDDELDMRMFVLTSNAQDIFEVSILPPGPGDETILALSINQFPAGGSPVEMLDYIDPEGDQKLMVLNGAQREIVIVDVETGNVTDMDIDWNLNQAVPYTLTDDETGTEENWALLYRAGDSTVVFANTDDIENSGTRALSSLVLSNPVGTVDVRTEGGDAQAVVVHQGGTALSVLQLRQQYDIPLPSSATVGNVAFSPAGDTLFSTVEAVAVMATIDLDNGHPSEVALAEPGGALAVLSDPAIVLVDHGLEEGRFTVMNAQDPSTENAVTVDGFLLDGLFGWASDGLGDE